MSPFSTLFLRISVAAALAVAVVLACGPFFGEEVLRNRNGTLLAPPTISFERELASLVPEPEDELPVVETDDSIEQKVTRDSVETKELAAPLLDIVNKMRQQPTGDAAYALGDSLPPAVRQYTAGAVSFSHGDSDSARTHFEALVAFPEAEQRRSRELWAHYMLGRMAVRRADQPEAEKQFAATRAVVRNGMPDPLGLALASYGEEASSAWQQGNIAHAVELYATQAAYGSKNALNSLLIVANRILKDENLLDKAVQDTKTRRLLFICLNSNNSRLFFVGPEAISGDEPVPVTGKASNVDKVVAALERHKINKASGAALLASAAYYAGRFDLAQKLSTLEDEPLSAWVKAKLALRKGNRDAALGAYEKAIKGFMAAEEDAGAEVRDLRAEAGVLRVSKGDYVQALDLFTSNIETKPVDNERSSWSGFEDYWSDIAYLAERVLTIEELRDYVDQHVSDKTAASMRLRGVLGRRLMRAERRTEALRYFDEKETRDAAQRYDSALRRADTTWRPTFLRAQALFDAASIARKNGMQILGFERDPDWAMWNGAYEPWEDSAVDAPAAKKLPKRPDPFVNDDERQRAAASKPRISDRFQYRQTAVDHAMTAADLLPASSQAFAAVLCEASGWVIDRQPKRGEELYVRYLHHGAYFPWAKSFARSCPEPNFSPISVFNVQRRVNHITRHAKAHPAYAVLSGMAAIAILAGLGYLFVRSRRAIAL